VPGQSSPGRRHSRSFGQHFLESATLARQLAHDAGIAPSDQVVEFGAGTGTLTAAVADLGARVLAIEVDPKLVATLVRRFGDSNAVTVFVCDAIEFPLPSTPFRVFANPPFNLTSAILHRLLDDPTGALVRADLVVQWQVARARAQAGERDPVDLVGASWGPWWDFRRGRRLPATLFRPSPKVDAAVLTVRRREPPLLPVAAASRFADFVRSGSTITPHPARVDDWVRWFDRGEGGPGQRRSARWLPQSTSR
jgi:23S rRNA (adenine-N6)-dimethyltransferase